MLNVDKMLVFDVLTPVPLLNSPNSDSMVFWVVLIPLRNFVESSMVG